MKEGDAVFHFNGKQIIEGICQACFRLNKKGPIFINCFFPDGIVETNDLSNHGQYFEAAILGQDVFNTRENLWYYYLEKLGLLKDGDKVRIIIVKED